MNISNSKISISQCFYDYEKGASRETEEKKDKKAVYEKVIEGDFCCIYEVYDGKKRVLISRYKINNIDNKDGINQNNSNLNIIKEAKKLKDVYETNYNNNNELNKEQDKKSTTLDDEDLIHILSSMNSNFVFN
ncbi:hypothetical protein WG909_04550 [Peptostreptococcaceae bacterium AGR-M142]